MKPRIPIKTGLCAIAFLAALSGCGGGGGGGSSSSTALPEAVATTLKVVVQDEMASPVAAARIRIAGADVTTDATGAVTATLPNSDTATVVLITKSGFATNKRLGSGLAKQHQSELIPRAGWPCKPTASSKTVSSPPPRKMRLKLH